MKKPIKNLFTNKKDIWYEDGEIYNSDIKNGYHTREGAKPYKLYDNL